MLVLVVVFGNGLRAWLGLSVIRSTPEELAEMLVPAFTVETPGTGTAPFPTAMLFSGCDGPKDNLGRLAEALHAADWASLIVDSHTPRALDEAELWRLVCAGQLLTGQERAADVAVGLAYAQAAPELSGDRVALVGASHGGWTVLDFLALTGAGELPPILEKWPAGFGAGVPAAVESVVLLYPYCGGASLAATANWNPGPRVLFVLVEGDTITGEDACLDLARRMGEAGVEVTVELLTGVTHGFDQQEKSPLSPLVYDAEVTARVNALIVSFIDG
ncbi:MAG: dienelactone hydrolase [Pseudomonadota bacterium]